MEEALDLLERLLNKNKESKVVKCSGTIVNVVFNILILFIQCTMFYTILFILTNVLYTVFLQAYKFFLLRFSVKLPEDGVNTHQKA